MEVNKFNLKLLSLFIAISAGIMGCSAVPSDPELTDGSTSDATPLTKDQVAGWHIADCEIVAGGIYGADIDGMSIYRDINLQADGSYTIDLQLYTGTVCQYGGTELFYYYQVGTYELGDVMADSGGTQVTYTSSSSMVTFYAGSGAGSTWATNFNNYCPGGPTFNTGATSAYSTAGITCSNSGSPDFSFPMFPADGTVTYDVIVLDSADAPTTVMTGTSDNLFEMGSESDFPTAADYSFAF